MKKHFQLTLLALAITGAHLSYGQGDSRPYNDNRSERREERRSERSSTEQYDRDLINAYKEGYKDGLEKARQSSPNRSESPNARDNRSSSSDRPNGNEAKDDISQNDANRTVKNDQQARPETTDQPASRETSKHKEKRRLPYKAFTGGFYVGANSTRYRGEDIDGQNLTGRLGYQVGVFTRFGGRLYGQLGAEYFTSSSNFFTPGDSLKLTDISGRINTQWIQVPVYVGFKLAQSKRGISGVRLAVGAEYANRIGGSNTVQLDNAEIKRGTFLALGNLGFDLGPLMIDIVYHHGLSDALKGFTDSQRRSLGINVGFKF